MAVERLLDARNMELPEPLMRALVELDALPWGGYLRLLVHRDPLLLYSMLESQAFSYTRRQLGGGGYEIMIWHAGDAVAEQAARS